MLTTSTAEAILNHHLAALAAQDIADVMSDYHTDAVLYTPHGAMRGSAAVETFFERAIASFPAGFIENITLRHKEIDDNFIYIVWQSLPFCPLATDTFIVRDGKIVQQTFAAFMPDGQ